jgi:hypothetical protein
MCLSSFNIKLTASPHPAFAALRPSFPVEGKDGAKHRMS